MLIQPGQASATIATTKTSPPRASAAWLLLLLGRALAQADLDILSLPITQDGDRHGVAGVLRVLDVGAQLAAGAGRLAVDGHDDVAAGRNLLAADGGLAITGPDTGLLGGAGDADHQESILVGRNAELLPGGLPDLGQGDRRHAQHWVAIATTLDQLRSDALDNADRNGE